MNFNFIFSVRNRWDFLLELLGVSVALIEGVKGTKAFVGKPFLEPFFLLFLPNDFLSDLNRRYERI